MPVLLAGVVLWSSLLAQVPTLEAPTFAKTMQQETILATVRIVNAKEKAEGSGVILAPRAGSVAYVLTAAHVIGEADSVEVQVFSNTSYPKPQRVYPSVRVVARRTENNQDLALLRIAAFGGESAGLEVCPTIPAGDTMTALASGCSHGNAPTLHLESLKTVLARRPGEAKPARFWRSDRKPIPGDSGGPLVNARGQVLGICSGAQKKQAFYCHLEDIHLFLRKSGLDSLLVRRP